MKNKSFSLSVLMSLAIVLLVNVSATKAQTVTGSIKGNIVDTSGSIVPGVSVEIISTETGLKRNVETNSEGSFESTFLPIGRYKVTVSKSGFGTVVRENVEVTLNQTSAVDFKIDPAVSETVTINDEAAPINTTNAQIAGSLTSQQISERPVLNQGNFLTLAETFTGYQENPTSGQNNPTASSGSSINFNGTGTRGATFQINGVNNDDSSENQNRQGASLATIKEFQVITNNFTAEFGRGYGAVVLVQTKSGTNQYKGEAYWYHNDSALNANSWSNNLNSIKKPVDRRNQFGGVFGFPVFKNKFFGFISFDHTEETGGGSYTRDIFTPSEKNQANWFNTTPANNTSGNITFIRSVLARFGDLTPNSPLSARTYAGVQGRDFPARDYSGRFDWNISGKDTVTGRWQYTRQIFRADDIIAGERADQNHHQNNGGLTWTHIFNPSLVGEFRYGLGLRTTLVNITAGNDTPIIRFQNPNSVAASSIGSAGNFPIQRYQTDQQFVYNISANIGSQHSLKAGTDLRFQRLDDLADNFSRGFYQFNTVCNGVNYGSGFNAFLNGCVANFQKGFGPFFIENRIGEKNFYVEDNWRIKTNLTLNLGLRYEYVNAPREVNDLVNYGFKDDNNNIEPRVGFAYSPAFQEGFLNKAFGEPGTSVIRGGYGIYHGRLFQSIFSQGGATVRFNPPNAFFYNQSTASALFNPNNLQDPTNGFVFVPGPQLTRHAEAIIDPGLEMPYTQQWNLTFERKLLWESAIRVSYTGNRGIGLLRYALDNLPLNEPNGVIVANHPNNAPNVLYTLGSLPANDPRRVDVRGQTLRLAADALCAGTGLSGIATNAACPVAVPIGPYEYSFRLPRTNERRPDGRFSTNTQVNNSAWSYYHGLQIELTKRLSQGLNFQAAYTWSKAIDTTSEATALGAGDSNQNGNDARASRGLSRFHSPHRFTFFGTYRLPFFDKEKNVLGQILGGWRVSTVFKWIHGTPFTLFNGSGIDLNFDGFAESRPVILDPRLLGTNISDRDTAPGKLPQSAFRAPTISDFGCCILGRNTFYLDGVKTIDFGLTKNFQMPFEGHLLNVRADMFNAFNHVQYGFPVTDINSATLGRINGTATSYLPRRIQVSLRYIF